MWCWAAIKITTLLLLSHDLYRLLHTCIYVVAVSSFHSGTANHSVHTMACCNAGELFHTSAKALLNHFNKASHYRLQLEKSASIHLSGSRLTVMLLVWVFFGCFFTLGDWTFEETSSSSLKTGNQKQFPCATHFPLPVLCKEQKCNMQVHCMPQWTSIGSVCRPSDLFSILYCMYHDCLLSPNELCSIRSLFSQSHFDFYSVTSEPNIWRTSQDLFRVKKFIGINMQKEIHFKTACSWLFFKPFYNMKTHV